MAQQNRKTLVIANLTGGMNQYDPPSMIPDDQCVDAANVDWYEGTLARKRGGALAIGVTFSSGGPFGGSVTSLLRHVPGNDETAAEMWAFDTSNVAARLAAATTWTAPTYKDALSSGIGVTGASLGGFFFQGYDSAQNRLHVWDASLSKVRRVGLATPDPPSAGTQGGSGLSFTRHYRIRVVDISGANTRRRSEASTSVSVTITDDTGVTVTRPTLPGEDETHWEVEYADASTGPWYRAAQVAAATSTYSDTAATISTTNLTADGINFPPPSAKYLLATDARILMAGNWETSGGYVTPKNNRVWWTPVIGNNDVGDSERFVTGSYLDVDEAITGLAGPLGGNIYVFSYRRIWKLVPTGVSSAPYQRFGLSTGIGCIDHKSIVMAEDENGSPALYFMSHKGPYRWGANGLQYLGMDVESITSTVNLAATTSLCHGVYDTMRHQVIWWLATGIQDEPNVRLKFDTQLGRTTAGNAVRRGWARDTGQITTAHCSVMFANTLGATMSRDLKPYLGHSSGTGRIWRCDTGTDDNGFGFQGYVDTKEYAPGGIGTNVALLEPYLLAEVSTGVTITVTGRQDFGARSDATGTALLTAVGTETRVQKKIEGFQSAQVGTVSYRIGDAATPSNAWTLDALIAPFTVQESR